MIDERGPEEKPGGDDQPVGGTLPEVRVEKKSSLLIANSKVFLSPFLRRFSEDLNTRSRQALTAFGSLRVPFRTGFLTLDLSDKNGGLDLQWLQSTLISFRSVSYPGFRSFVNDAYSGRSFEVIPADFATVSYFMDLVLDLVTDDELNSFFDSMASKEARHLVRALQNSPDLVSLLVGEGTMSAEAAGLFTFLQVSRDIKVFVENLDSDYVERIVIESLWPYYGAEPQLKSFFSDVATVCQIATEAESGDEVVLSGMKDLLSCIRAIDALADLAEEVKSLS